MGGSGMQMASKNNVMPWPREVLQSYGATIGSIQKFEQILGGSQRGDATDIYSIYVLYISTTGVGTLLRTPTRRGKRTTRRITRSRTERGCADTLLLGAAWVLCVPPSRALGTVATAEKALNHGADDHRPIFALFASADIPKPTSRHPKCWCSLISFLFWIVLSYLPSS